MRDYTVADLSARRAATGDLYHEFLRVPAMSAGLYELAAGAEDPQEPHTEDELYYVVSGRARLRVGAEDVAEDVSVAAGSLVYVPANVPHQFHDISEALAVLVFFAPAEYSQTQGAGVSTTGTVG